MPEDSNQFDEAGAAAALESLMANQGGAPDEGPPAVEPVAAEQAEPPVAPAAEPTEPEATEPEFSPRADLESLLEGVTDTAARERITDAYKSFQRDYTRKTQDLAAERRRLGDIDPDTARQSIEFFERLQSDRDFALEVHKELSQALEAAGATPKQAAEAATEQLSGPRTPASYEEYGIDPDNPLAKDLAELRAWRAEEEQRRAREAQERQYEEQRQQMIADIERQANAVRRANPQYDDDDMDAIYKIAGSLNGDIEAAADYFQAQQDRIVTNYIARKGKAAPGTAPAPSGGTSYSETPKEFRTTDEAHEIAKDWLLGRMGQDS